MLNSKPETTEDWRETDPDYYRMLADEGRIAKRNNLRREDCEYPEGSIERGYWMDGFDD